MVPDSNAVGAGHAVDHGLHFTNTGWNGTISNGEPFTLRWNESLNSDVAELGLFRLIYPQDGLIMYELVSNLTDSISSQESVWTPEGLKDDLYAFWLSTKGEENPNWTISPPWRPKELRNRVFHWAAPVGIPIVALLGLYGIVLIICVIYRRRKKARRENQPTPLPDEDASGRHPSVSSAVTVQTYDESDILKKPSISVFTDSSAGTRVASDTDYISDVRHDCTCHIREPEKTLTHEPRTDFRRYSMA